LTKRSENYLITLNFSEDHKEKDFFARLTSGVALARINLIENRFLFSRKTGISKERGGNKENTLAAGGG
jgi:hypothetical protein